MTIRPLGDSAWLVEFPRLAGGAALARVLGLARALETGRPPGVTDVVTSYAALAVHFRGRHALTIRDWIGAAEIEDVLPAGERVEIPVDYRAGLDLDEVARRTGLTADEVVALHSGADYTVAAVGFAPGFPYLLGLPERLHLPRRSTPRLAVPAGAVAIGAAQAGIYPFESPGGWHVLGRTDVPLFDPAAVPPALLRPGQRVRFVPAGPLAPPAVRRQDLPAVTTDRWVEVVEPGSLTSVQDGGRPGWQAAGVSPGGAVDRHALQTANLLVGNPPDAAVLELCLSGPVLRFHGAATVALAAATGKSRRVADGETVDFRRHGGTLRACLAVDGGFALPPVLGSCATDERAGFGGRRLEAGDALPLGQPGRPPRCGAWHTGREERRGALELRFLRGAGHERFSEEALRRFRRELFRITPESDRMGVRLSGPELTLAGPGELLSHPVADGAVQVPPAGQPIVLLAGRQTLGGYPQIGNVISVDLPKLARAWPGTAVHFREVTWEEARALLRQQTRGFARLAVGLDFLK